MHDGWWIARALGNKVIKAFIPTDWSFFNEKGRLMTIDDLLKGTHVTPKKLKWTVHHFSCRRQESSHLSGVCSTSNLPARKASRSIWWPTDGCLYQPSRHSEVSHCQQDRRGIPVCCLDLPSWSHEWQEYTFLFPFHYLTASKIAEVFQSVAKICHPDLTRDEIMRFTSHSIRVWAIVLLDEAGMNADFIKSQLRWMGDS